MRYKEIDPSGDLSKYRGWCASTKHDGWMARWTGTRLLTKTGKREFKIPIAWRDALHRAGRPLLGEIVILNKNAPAVASLLADGARWSQARFHVFDAPGDAKQTFRQRQCNVRDAVERVRKKFGRGCPIRQVPQAKVTTAASLRRMFDKTKRKGLEGLVVSNPETKYEEGKRSANRVKLKVRSDEEAKVTGYKAKGKRLSGLTVRRRGVTFQIGTGFTEAQRKNYKRLFPIGTIIKYSYRSKTASGKPKEATYMHKRVAPK